MIYVSQSVLGQITEIFEKRKKAIHLDNYYVGELFDHGGMSNIYRLIDQSGNSGYVLRVSEEHKSPYSNDIFNVRELKILQELKKNRQPHVVQYLDAFAVDAPGGQRYYCSVMKFLCTLKQYRVSGDGVEIAVRLGGDLLPLLQSFTDKGILHRDIKPGNIFYDADFRNSTGFLLGDFGIAKRDTDTSVTPTGTESTMAPEVRCLDRSLGSDRSRSDMYSLGIVMYRYLNEGIYPSNRERIDRMPPDTAPFPAPRFGSRRLKKLVVKATAYYPDDRFESPQEMLRELQKCEEYKTFVFNEVASADDTMDMEEILQAEKKALEEQLNQKKRELEDAVHRFSLKENELLEENDALKARLAERETALLAENEALKAKLTEHELLLEENDALKAQLTEHELLLEENDALKARLAEHETLLEENEALKAELAEREKLLEENDALKAQLAEREKLLEENDALKAQLAEYETELVEDSKEADPQATEPDEEEPSESREADPQAVADEDDTPAGNEAEQARSSGGNEDSAAGTENPEFRRPAEERRTIPKRQAGSPLDLHVGDRIHYGRYPQGADGKELPIMWRVLAVERKKALIISELLIDTMPYHDINENVTWEDSYLRRWLNSEFVFTAFGGRLPRRGIESYNINPDNAKHGTIGGAPTYDMVFALSIDEAQKYFRDNADRMAGLSEYAKTHGAWVSNEYLTENGENAGLWWLRSPGFNSQAAARVLINGDINTHGSSVTRDNVAVRPAMWIKTG